MLYVRYPYHFTAPNFYGEDGNVYVENIYNKGPIAAIFTLFNGYLIFLQYIVVVAGFLLNKIVGGDFITLSKSLAVVSFFTISAVCSLVWLLFRKKIGDLWAIIAFIFLLFVPLAGSDFAVIGTVGNLKFLFFFLATILIIYRNDPMLCSQQSKKIYLIDTVLLMCVLTNITVVALIPLGLLRYKNEIKRAINKKHLRPLMHLNGLVSLVVLMGISGLYVMAVYINGVPEMPGYLDTPLRLQGLLNSFYRSSWYGVLYPLHTSLNQVVVLGLLLIAAATPLLMRKKRVFLLTILWAIFITAAGFVFNRPGVTEFLIGYNTDGGPGQFFYGGTMLFIFAIFYLSADWFKRQKGVARALVLFGIVMYAVWAFPYAGFQEKSYAFYANRPTLYEATRQACANSAQDKQVTIEIYPLEGWQMDIEREIACQSR